MNNVQFNGKSKSSIYKQGDIFVDNDKGDLFILAQVDGGVSYSQWNLISLKNGNRWHEPFQREDAKDVIDGYGCFTHLGACNIVVSEA